MNKTQLVEEIAQKAGVSKQVAKSVLDASLQAIIDASGRGEKVALPGFGSFSVKKRNERKGVDPRQTGKEILIPARMVVAFKAGSELDGAVRALDVNKFDA